MQIITAAEPDAPALGELIAGTFSRLTASRWLVDDENDWQRIAPRWFAGMVRDAIGTGAVYTVPDLSAALVMYDHTVPRTHDPEREGWLMDLAGRRYFERFVRFEQALAAAHPNRPHYYGALIAVRESGQNDGIGSALLDHHHRIADELGHPVYGEASSSRLFDYFSRQGYVPHGPPVTLDGEELVQPMWREASASKAAASASCRPLSSRRRPAVPHR